MKTKGWRIAIVTGAVAIVVLAVAAWRVGLPLLRFWKLFEPLGRNAQGFSEYRHRQTGIVMVSLAGGKFPMGAQKTDPKGPNYDPEAEDDERPVHEVTLSPFLIGKFEVTQAGWKAAMGSNPSKFMGDDQPVEQVSWDDIQGFNAKTGFRLTTEAEWEYACRGGSAAPIAGTGMLKKMGWYSGNTGTTTNPVGKKNANGFSLHDMHGNVREWCEDVYEEGFYVKPEAVGPDPVGTHDPVGRSPPGLRVIRGGCWRDHPMLCRSSVRGWFERQYRDEYLGFRVIWRP